VAFGGLKGEVAYSDQAFGLDPDIQQLFYGSHYGGDDPEATTVAETVLSRVDCIITTFGSKGRADEIASV
jgi:hypothetical protein